MDMYGPTPPLPELFRVDDLLDFSNDDLFTPTDTDIHNHHHRHEHAPLSENNSSSSPSSSSTGVTAGCSYFDVPGACYLSSADDLSIPSDDVAELEWLSKFVDDSFTDYPASALAGTVNLSSENATFQPRSKIKRPRSTISNHNNSTRRSRAQSSVSTGSRDVSATPEAEAARRCTHCSSEKTPQWRTGPLGPKTLCNACGVRYKSGRLVQEYRPAASPTFVLTQHSNSHRKVLELRRQKEMLRSQVQPQQQEQQMYGLHNFQVC